jgi:hypothetical protein
MSTKKPRQKKPDGAAKSRQLPFFVPEAAVDEQKFFSLPKAVQAQMEDSLGADFTGVKIVPESAAAPRIRANAFTQAETVHFAPGKYDPASAAGKELIGHELAHVVQQRQGRVRPSFQGQGLAINTDRGLETEADRLGKAAARGEATPTPASARTGSSGVAAAPVIQGDFAVAPTVANPVFQDLTAQQVTRALSFDRIAFTDADEIAVVRDVLGIAAEPAAVDEDFVRAVGRYQAQNGLNQDGVLGAGTARQLAAEMQAEAAFLGPEGETGSATKIAVAPAARRMALRGQVRRRLGTLAHQGFVGDRLNPAGIVSVREGDAFGAATDRISIEYTGAGGATAEWLQFAHVFMFGFAPGSPARVNMTGNIATTSGPAPLSQPGTIHWHVDSASAVTPFYAAGGSRHERVGRSITIGDKPGGASANPIAAGFAASQAPALDRVRFLAAFETYLVRNNRVEYRVRWTATTHFDIAAGAVTNTRGPFFDTLDSGSVGAVRAAQRTAVDARYPGNGIL